MVTIETIIQEVFDLPRMSRPLCLTRKAKPTKAGGFTKGWIKIDGVELNIERFTKRELLLYIQYHHLYRGLISYKRERFGFCFYINTFVYGSLFAAVGSHLVSRLQPTLPVFLGFQFKSFRGESDAPIPRRFVKGFRYIDRELIIVGRLIYEEWLKMTRERQNPSSTLET